MLMDQETENIKIDFVTEDIDSNDGEEESQKVDHLEEEKVNVETHEIMEQELQENLERQKQEQMEKDVKEEEERLLKEEADREKMIQEECELRLKHEEELEKAREFAEKERVEREAREHAESVRQAEREEAKRLHQAEIERIEREAREHAEREAREHAEREAREHAEREAREHAEREAREHAEREAREHAEREAREHAEREREIMIQQRSLIPRIVFIIPYRDREQQKSFFNSHMKMVMSDYPENAYKIFYIHQTDDREFNRGAMKNIGFLFIKKKYPNDYQNITIVFNDIDTMPYTKNFLNYETTRGTIKHFYGFKFALGGIVSITGGDFEKINGFPNFWAWGYEDNELYKRVLLSSLLVDRSQFYTAMDKNILQLKDGIYRTINRNEFDRYISSSTEGISSIYNLDYQHDESSELVNVTSFLTGTEPIPSSDKQYDIRQGSRPYGTPVIQKPPRNRRAGSMKMVF
jgi:hypothetical protein